MKDTLTFDDVLIVPKFSDIWSTSTSDVIGSQL
jgi:IMP dehydrogenase/GMP reductase